MTWGTQLALTPEDSLYMSLYVSLCFYYSLCSCFEPDFSEEKEILKQNFSEIQATAGSFCALRADGSLFQWGEIRRWYLPELDRKVKKIQANQLLV